MKREHEIDLLRGFAILLVIFGHGISYGLAINFAGHATELRTVLYTCCYKIIYAFHIPLFFWISGVVSRKYSLCDQHIGKIIKKNTKAILYPYLVFVGLYYLERWIANIVLEVELIEPLERTAKDIIFMFLNPKSQAWFLLSLYCVKLFHDLCIRIFKLKPALVCVLWLVIYMCDILVSQPVMHWIIHNLREGIYYSLGYYYVFLVENKNIHENSNVEKLAFALVACGAIIEYTVTNVYVVFVIKMPLAVSICILLYNNRDKIPRLKSLSVLGKYSLCAYCLHGLLNGLVIAILSVMRIPWNLCFPVISAIIQLVAIYVYISIGTTFGRMNWMMSFFYWNYLNGKSGLDNR